MEVIGAVLVVVLVLLVNAKSFFSPVDYQKRLYDKTAADTNFNKSARQTP